MQGDDDQEVVNEGVGFGGDACREWLEITSLSFDGRRFSSHAVEVEVTKELIAFQEIVTDLAADTWRKEHPDRVRLPKGFEEMTRLRFRTIVAGSSTLPLEAPVQSAESLGRPKVSPYVSQAIDLVLQAVKSQEEEMELPQSLPRGSIVNAFAQWGSTLREDESITIREAASLNPLDQPKQAKFTLHTRKRFSNYVEAVYDDVVTLYGEIRAMDRDRRSSLLRLPNQTRVAVRFDQAMEAAFAHALESSVSVAVTGLARISRIDGFVQQIASVTDFIPLATPPQRTGALSEWLEDATSGIDWSSVPSDYGRKVDSYLYDGEKNA